MPVNSNKSTKAGIFRSWPFRILLLVFCLWLLSILTGRILCKIALDQIAELTNTEITTESVDFNTNGSVFIRGLVIKPKQQKNYDDTILKAKTVYARFGIGSLLLLNPRLKKISVKDFVFDAQHDLDTGRWNISKFGLKSPKAVVGKIPAIRLKRGTLQYSKVSYGQVKAVAAVPINAEFNPARKTRKSYSFNITTADRAGRGKSVLTGFCEPGRVKITGGISSADIPAFEKAWTINALDADLNYDRNNAYSLKLKIEYLHSRNYPAGDTFVADRKALSGKPGLFAALQRFFNRYSPSGTVAIDLLVRGSLEQLSESTLTGKILCKDISICDRRFPYPVKQLTGQIDLTEKGAVLNNLCGRHGDTKIIYNGWSQDFGQNWKYQIQITSSNMTLDNDLYSALSTKQKKFWSAFSPSGLVAIDYKRGRRSQTDKEVILAVNLLGVEAAYRRFSYPLKNLSGKLLFTRDSITVSDVTSQANDRKIIINGKVTAYKTERPIYKISVKAKDIPLDSTLARSLPDKESDFYNQLNMTGLADADIKIFTPEQNSGRTSFIADVSLKKTSLKANDFPIAVSNVSAKTVITPDAIQIEDFTGRYNQALVSLTGRIWPADKAQKSRYNLSLNAEHAQLNDELISLLPQRLKNIVSELQPEGEINLTVNMNKTGGEDLPDYKITMDCCGNSVNFEPFTYPIKGITGRLTISKNAVTLENITATVTDNTLIMSNISTLKVNGQIMLVDDNLNGGQPELSSGYITFNADNLNIKGKLLTDLTADTYYDPNGQSWKAKNLTADCYDGRLIGKFELKRSTDAALEYLLQLGFDNIDLKQFLENTNSKESSGNNTTSGKMNGVLSLAGRTSESLPNIGRCRLLITDMQVGKLSPLAKLLYVLKMTKPKDFAFEQMLIDSYIKHNRLFLEQLDLSGKAVAFNGSGWVNLQNRNADLVLFARGRRLATSEPSILQSLTEGLGHAVVKMKVAGDVYDPKVTTTPLPVIDEAVKILGAPSP